MTKITTLVLATIATLGLSSAAFADVARPTVKHQVRITHVQPVTPKKLTVHWIGTKRYVLVRGHKVWLSPQAQYTGKKRLASHVTFNKQKRLASHATFNKPKHFTSRVIVNKPKHFTSRVIVNKQKHFTGRVIVNKQKHLATHVIVNKQKRTKVAS
jgi:hypothetical protein